MARRLQATLEHLIRVLPEAQRKPPRQEPQLLHNSVERGFSNQRDRIMAEISDNQGVGGSAPSE